MYVQLIVCCSPSEVSAPNVTAPLAISADTSIESSAGTAPPLYSAVALPVTDTTSVSPTS